MLDHERESVTHRRGFIGGLAAGALALATTAMTAPDLVAAPAIVPESEPDEWLKGIKGSHKQYFDATSVNDGFALAYAMNYLDTMTQTYKLPANDITAVVGLRHMSIPIAFDDAIWSRYKLGSVFNVADPATKAPATRNRFMNPKDGDLMFPGMAIDKLQSRGTVFVVCNVALTVLSGMAAQAAGLPQDRAKQEWTEALRPGFHIVPSGVLAVARAQERGCTYCYAG